MGKEKVQIWQKLLREPLSVIYGTRANTLGGKRNAAGQLFQKGRSGLRLNHFRVCTAT